MGLELLKPDFNRLFVKMEIQLFNGFHEELYPLKEADAPKNQRKKRSNINSKNYKKDFAKVDPLYLTTSEFKKDFENDLKLLEGTIKLKAKEKLENSKRIKATINLEDRDDLYYYFNKEFWDDAIFLINYFKREKIQKFGDEIVTTVHYSFKYYNEVQKQFILFSSQIMEIFVSHVLPKYTKRRKFRSKVLTAHLLTYCGFFVKVNSYPLKNNIDYYKRNLYNQIDRILIIR